MLANLLKLRNRLFPPPSPANSGQGRSHDTDVREHRALVVSGLRDDIQRLQHEISTLNDTITAGSAPDTAALERRMESLHRELAECQRKLGTYQARI